MPDSSDFQPDELVKEHGRSIQDLRAAVDKLTERFGDEDKFVSTFETVARKDKRVDLVIKTSLRALIESDPDTSETLKSLVSKIDRAWMGMFTKRLGLAVWSIALLVIGGLIEHFVGRH